ncbi:uncharacterized protein LOC144006160 isoform X2 [Festucalex cinctus]
MCDQQQKVKHKKTDAKSQEMKQHHSKQNQHHPHHHHHKFHQSDEDNQDTHSTAEDSLLSDHLPHHHHHHHHDSHHYHHKLSHDQLSLSETSFTSSYGSSSSTFSSSSTTASSSSCSSSSNSSPTSASSSSLSSESSSEGSGRFLLRRPQHSQSCTNISEKCKYVEEGEDAAPLIGNRGHGGKQKQEKGKSARNGSKQGTQKKTHESFRKSKSMEALTRPAEKDGHANEEEEERRKNEVRKNLMKEKMKFSAFLNEITRQVLSPMRLTTLGVTNAQKASSSEPTSVRSRKSESNADPSRQQSRRPVSADSVDSSRYSHNQLSKSKSAHHHRSRRSPDSPNHVQARPRSCTDISCLERHPSWSQTSQRCSRSPSCKQHRRRHYIGCRHHSDRHGPSYHRYPRSKSPHHRRRRYSPVFYPSHGDSDSSSYYHDKRSPRSHDGGHSGGFTPHHADCRDPTFHQQSDRRYQFYNHANVPRYGDHHSAMYHREEHHNRAAAHHQIRNTSSASPHHKDHPSKTHHHSNHLNMKRPTTPRHGNQAQGCDQSNKPYSKHHHGNHHGIEQHHSFRPGNRGDHGDGGHHPHQKAKPNEFGEHHRPSHRSPNRQRHSGDDLKELHRPDDEESQNSYQEHRSGSHHSPNRDDHHTQHGGRHSPNGQHHNRDHVNSHRQHHHGDHKSPNSQKHEGHHSRNHQNHHEPHQNKLLSKNEPEHEDKRVLINRESAPGLPPHQKKAVLSCKMDSTRKMISPSGRDEEQTDFTGPSKLQEATHEMDKIMTLQEENEGLQQSLLKSAVKMEYFGEFLNSHKLLEEELQRTRVELSNLTESFKILHENCSSTQQTNSLLEQKLNSMTRSMEGERERLSRRISALTEQLAGAKFDNNMDTSNINSVLNQTNEHLHLDDAVSQVMLPLAPPPLQFMDSQNYEKVTTTTGQEQCLGSVPEEEESDWSEMGEEIPRFILTGSNRSQAWMHREGDMDKDSESGGMTGDSTFRITAGQNLGSTVLIRSASLEELPLACHQMPKELRGTEAMMDLHHPGDEASDDLDNEIIHHWRTTRDGRASEAESAPCSLQSVEQMLNRFMCEPQPGEGICQSRSEMHGWTGGIAEEVLGGEQTQL